MSYLRERMSKLPHGSFGSVRGVPTVTLSYDPCNPQINSYNRKRYYLSSTMGRFYKPLIEEYISLKNELKELERVWNLIYKIPPRHVEYPLAKRRYSMFDGDFFDKAIPNSNGREVENPIEYKGMIVRSKNELLACEILEKKGYEIKVEPKVGDKYEELYPDILFGVREQCKCIGLEIEGALDRERYAYKSTNRRKGYLKLGFEIGKDIIFLDLADPYSFSAELLETKIRLAVEASLDDIIFPGE